MWVATNNTGQTIAIRDEEGKHLVENGDSLFDVSKSVANQCRSRGFDVDWVQSLTPHEPEPVEPEPVEADEKPKRKATVKVSED